MATPSSSPDRPTIVDAALLACAITVASGRRIGRPIAALNGTREHPLDRLQTVETGPSLDRRRG